MSTESLPSAQILQHSREAGYLAKQAFIITTEPVNPGPQLENILKNLDAHIDYWEDLCTKEKVLAGGPWTAGGPENDWHAIGMIVVWADSIEEAKKMGDGDPFHKLGIRSFTVNSWLVNHLALSHRRIM